MDYLNVMFLEYHSFTANIAVATSCHHCVDMESRYRSTLHTHDNEESLTSYDGGHDREHGRGGNR
ncbi:MAG: hypothetical protein K2I45_11150, partial [Muribaculaceae bacterium]|nr:hypothetical protein [Muribaculaceae bacterium]